MSALFHRGWEEMVAITNWALIRNKTINVIGDAMKMELVGFLTLNVLSQRPGGQVCWGVPSSRHSALPEWWRPGRQHPVTPPTPRPSREGHHSLQKALPTALWSVISVRGHLSGRFCHISNSRSLSRPLSFHANPCGASTMEKGRSAKKTTSEASWPHPWEESDCITLRQEVVFWALLHLTGYSCLEKFSPSKWISMHLEDGRWCWQRGREMGRDRQPQEACPSVICFNLFVNTLLLEPDGCSWCLLWIMLYLHQTACCDRV